MQNIPNLRPVCQEPFSIETLLQTAKISAELERLLVASAQVWENYTIEEHTKMVLGMFERFWARYYQPEERQFWRLFLLLHDIGKPISVEKYGTKDNQHETTWPVMKEVMETAGFSELELARAHALLEQDILGKYFKDRLSLNDSVKEIQRVQDEGKWTMDETTFRLKTFFCSDAGGYTQFAGGSYSLDYLFEVDEKHHTINFSNQQNDKPEYQLFTTLGKFEILEAALTAASLQ